MTDELMASLLEAYQNTIEQGQQGQTFLLILVVLLLVVLIGLIVRVYGSADQRGDALTGDIVKLLGKSSDQYGKFTQVVENNTQVMKSGLSNIAESQVQLTNTIENLQGALALQTSKMSELINDVRHWPKLVNDTLHGQRESFNSLTEEIQINRDATSGRFEKAEAAWNGIDGKLDRIIELLNHEPEVTSDE